MTPEQVILRIARAADAWGWQAGVGASEMAGMVISCLAARPELIERFLADPNGTMLDERFTAESGCLSFHSQDGQVRTPEELRTLNQLPLSGVGKKEREDGP